MANSNISSVQVQKEVKGVDYPASKQELDHLSNSGESSGVRDLLGKIPDKEYISR